MVSYAVQPTVVTEHNCIRVLSCWMLHKHAASNHQAQHSQLQQLDKLMHHLQTNSRHAQEILLLGMCCWLALCCAVAAAQCSTKALSASGLVYLLPGRPCIFSG